VLQRFVQEGRVPPGRALVPGCGRGYDVALLAAADRHATGLDFAPAAVAAARAFLAAEHPEALPFLAIERADFFAHAAENTAAYDFVFDYTFLCALQPPRRADWGRAMAALIKPGGVLLTMQYPLRSPPGRAEDDFATGPPFLLTPGLYADLLGPAFALVDEGDVPPSDSDPRRVGAERWAWWQRRAAPAPEACGTATL